MIRGGSDWPGIPEYQGITEVDFWEYRLADEVTRWKLVSPGLQTVEAILDLVQNPLYCQEPELGENFAWERFDVGRSTAMSWGWLEPEGRGEKGDFWSLHTDDHYLPEGREWFLAHLPKSWTGTLNQWLGGDYDGAGIVVGSFYEGKRRANWIAGCEWTEPPEWPRLEIGTAGSRLRADLVLLGVLRRTSLKAGTAGGDLDVAWGDKAGGFMGWTRVVSMLQIGDLEARAIIDFGELKEWEKFERKLRVNSLGRVL